MEASIRVVRSAVLPLLLAVLLEVPSAAQITGRLSGRVENPAGEPVVGAVVTLSLPDWTGTYASTVTSSTGAFSFRLLKPAIYELTVEAPTFAKQVVTNLRISPVSETALPPIQLAAGAGQVVAANSPVQPEPAGIDVAFTLDSDEVARLPVAARDPFDLFTVLPGVTENGRAPVSIYGESLSLGNITYEGTNLRKDFTFGRGLNSAALWLHTDQVQEMTVVTNAVEGCGCAQIALTAPGGGNALHGSGYWLAAPSGTTAQLWTNNSLSTPANNRLNQLGAAVGGPLKKDRLFFFLNYEADLDRSTVTRTGTVPTAPLSTQDPLLRQVLALVPASPSGLYRGVQNNGYTVQNGIGRLDYLASPRHSLGLTFANGTSSQDDPFDSSVFGRAPTTTAGGASRFWAGFWRWSATPRMTNELRAGESRSRLDYRNSLRDRFGFIAVLSDPAVAISQPMAGMDPRALDDTQRSLQDNFTWILGKHSLKAGFWFQQYRLKSYGVDYGLLDSLTVPRYVVDNISQGTVAASNQRFNLTSPTSGYTRGSTARSNLSTTMTSVYLHDEWKLFRSLSVTVGMRYDYLAPADEQTGLAILPVISTANAANAIYSKTLPFAFAGDGPYRHDKDNDGPYLGIAWKPFARFPVVVRGGVSTSYLNDDLLYNLNIFGLRNPFQSFDVATNLSANPVPLSSAPVTPAPVLPATLSLPTLLAFANSYHQQPRAVYGIDPKIATPNIKYWHLGVQFPVQHFDMSVRYLGNRLEEGPRSVNRDQTMLSPAFLQAFQQVQTDLKNGNPTQGIPLLPGGGICSNFSLRDCVPDLYARSLIVSGQVGELARWLEGQGYNPNGAYNFLGNPLAPQGIYLLSHLGVSRYDALEWTVTRHAAAGLTLTASYLFSQLFSSFDDLGPGAIDPYVDVYNHAIEWAPSPFSVRHSFKAASVWDLPLSRFGNSTKSVTGRLLNGWTVSGIVIAQSGAPFSLVSGGYVTTPQGSTTPISGLGTFSSQADSAQNTVDTSLTAPEIRRFFGIRKNPDGTLGYVTAPASAFQEPGPGSVGVLQRRMFSGPGALNVNVGIRKGISLTERITAEFRADAINLLNNVNWLVGDQTFYGADVQNNTSVFGGSVTQWNPPRTMQFGVRVSF